MAATTIPIVDFDQTFGPLSLVRKLTATVEATSTTLATALQALSETGWTGPEGSLGNLNWNVTLPFTGTYIPGTSARLAFMLAAKGDSGLAPFGMGGPTVTASGRMGPSAFPVLYLGGPDGLGAGFAGQLAQGDGRARLAVPDVGSATAAFAGFLGRISESQLVVLPGGGLTARLGVNPVNGFASVATTLGQNAISATASANLRNDAFLCTGSAAAGCDGAIARNTAEASFSGRAAFTNLSGGVASMEINLPNYLDVTLKPDRLSITGLIGGEVTFNDTTTVGRIVPIDVQIPLGSTPLRLAATRANSAAATEQNTTRAPRATAVHNDRKTGTARSGRTGQRGSAD